MRGASIIGLSWALAASASAQDFSPIPVRNFRPYSTLFLRFEAGQAPLAIGERELTITAVAANSLNYVPNRLVNPIAKEDIENDRFDVRLARGLGRGWEASGQVTLEAMGSGFLDPVISWYHRAFLRLHNLRNQIPYGGHVVYSPSGGPFHAGAGLGDVSLFISRTVGGASFVTAGIKLPTGDPNQLLGSGNVDVGVAGQTQWRIGRMFGLTAAAGVVAQGKATRLRHTRALVLQGTLAAVYAPNCRDAWIAQANYEQSPNVEGVEALDKLEPSTSVGFRRRLNARESVTAYFCEDINPFNSNFPVGANIGPDFTIGITWTRRL